MRANTEYYGSTFTFACLYLCWRLEQWAGSARGREVCLPTYGWVLPLLQWVKTGNSQLMKNMLAKRKMLTCHTEHQVRLRLQSRNVCRLRGERRGMTNHPIGPHRTQSGSHRDPIGPHRTPSHSTSYFLPPTTWLSFILSLACTLQTRSIIDEIGRASCRERV